MSRWDIVALFFLDAAAGIPAFISGVSFGTNDEPRPDFVLVTVIMAVLGIAYGATHTLRKYQIMSMVLNAAGVIAFCVAGIATTSVPAYSGDATAVIVLIVIGGFLFVWAAVLQAKHPRNASAAYYRV